MPQLPLHDPNYRRDMGDGLVLRWASPGDVEGIAALYSEVFRDKDDPPNAPLAAWTHDLMSGRHPHIVANDFALVEDTNAGAVVAATCLLRQSWEYAGIAFPVGRPEIVASMPGYRERGLVRAVFDLIHARSDAEGHMAQGITGIPYYYRQFGYEYALDLGGWRVVFNSAIPPLAEGATEPFVLRPATVAEIPQVLALYDQDRATRAISTPMSAEYLRWVIEGQSFASGEGWDTQLIVRANEPAAPLGYLFSRRHRWNHDVAIVALHVAPGVPLPGVLPSVLRALAAQGARLHTPGTKTPPFDRLLFGLGRKHAVYDALGDLAPLHGDPYAWYVRVRDLPALVMHLAPVLEARLAASPVAGLSEELRLDFYRGGLRMVFESGKLQAAEPWNVRAVHYGPKPTAGFPPLVFLQLLFGHRSLSELRHTFPDVRADGTTRLALEAMFPPLNAWALNLD
ncbi:hypothetical protein SE17_29540 [Kouleothrix aurantiaca]|uniref:N-acetyltransferase domain-containing protein n=1 Tax=Kouleothrix aurantiaca TaxID=186479 RepID=A0A0P9H817_9CHLR|nr:hypothetical protein SE17_29540 [Kouleothrix aurantiaca]